MPTSTTSCSPRPVPPTSRAPPRSARAPPSTRRFRCCRTRATGSGSAATTRRPHYRSRTTRRCARRARLFEPDRIGEPLAVDLDERRQRTAVLHLDLQRVLVRHDRRDEIVERHLSDLLLRLLDVRLGDLLLQALGEARLQA